MASLDSRWLHAEPLKYDEGIQVNWIKGAFGAFFVFVFVKACVFPSTPVRAIDPSPVAANSEPEPAAKVVPPRTWTKGEWHTSKDGDFSMRVDSAKFKRSVGNDYATYSAPKGWVYYVVSLEVANERRMTQTYAGLRLSIAADDGNFYSVETDVQYQALGRLLSDVAPQTFNTLKLIFAIPEGVKPYAIVDTDNVMGAPLPPPPTPTKKKVKSI